MHRIYSTLVEMAAASVFLIPAFAIYGKYRLYNVGQTLCHTVFGFYLVAVLALVGFPNITYMRFGFNINLMPFVGIPDDFVNACLNVLLFVPLGFLLPVLWNQYRNIKSTLAVALCMTVGIELAQIFTFRATDINDILTNVSGAAIGYLAAKAVTRNFMRYVQTNAETKQLYVICAAVAVIMFFLQPFVSMLLWEMIL